MPKRYIDADKYYETKLKSEMIATLIGLQSEIDKKIKDPALDDRDCAFNNGLCVSGDIIQQKINTLL